MKNFIGLVIFGVVMVGALWYGLNKTIDNRCDYYRTLDMTPAMHQLCDPQN